MKHIFNLENYTSINHVRKYGGGGSMYVFIHNSLTFKLKFHLATSSSDIELLAIEIINKKSKHVVISTQYRQAGDFKQYKRILKNSLVK